MFDKVRRVTGAIEKRDIHPEFAKKVIRGGVSRGKHYRERARKKERDIDRARRV
jgi:hypothetical protein